VNGPIRKEVTNKQPTIAEHRDRNTGSGGEEVTLRFTEDEAAQKHMQSGGGKHAIAMVKERSTTTP